MKFIIFKRMKKKYNYLSEHTMGTRVRKRSSLHPACRKRRQNWDGHSEKTAKKPKQTNRQKTSFKTEARCHMRCGTIKDPPCSKAKG